MRRQGNLAHGLVCAGAALWSGTVFLAPLAQARGWSGAPLIYEAFHRVCHQIPARSFAFLGHPLAVCHRCLGLYLGFTAGALILPFFGRSSQALLARPRWIVAASLPMLVDVVLPFNTAWSRFGTGFLAAFPVSLLVWAAVGQILGMSSAPLGEEYEPG